MAASNDLNISTAGYVVFDGTATFFGRTFQAGTGITLTNPSGVVGNTTISASAVALNYTSVNHAASPYTVLTTDDYISCDTSGGAITLLFPNAPATPEVWVIKDRTGNATANNITITTVGGAINIDGATSQLVNSNFGAVQMLFNGTTFELY